MKGSKMPRIHPYLFILFIAVLTYWPMSLMLFSAKNDAIHYFLAMRYNSSEMIQHGIFPAWSPYINLGYPMHGDIQSGVWNPLVFLMSAIRQYDIYWLHTEIILINVIAGIGMFRLLSFLKLQKNTALGISIAYMLNGYMTDAGQFLNWLYAGAILPFVVLYAVKAFRTFLLRDAFALGLSFSMMLLCGYPADSILTAYLLVAWFLVSLFSNSKKTGFWTSLKKHLQVALPAFVSFLIISLPALISFLGFFPEVRRGSGVPLYLAQSNSLAPANLVSLLFPWATLKGNAFAETDPLIRNCYIGILPFCFFILFLLKRGRKDLFQKFLVGTAVFFLVFSLGKYGGLRYLSYEFLPLMDSFRHPANAKLFFLFAMQVLAAFALNSCLEEELSLAKKLRIILLFILVLAGLIVVYTLMKSQALTVIKNVWASGLSQAGYVLKLARDQLTGFDLTFLNSLFVVFLAGTILWILRKGLLKKYLVAIVCVEMFMVAQMMLPLTYVRNYSPAAVQQLLDEQPTGYPIPELRTTLAENSRDGMVYFEDIGCLNPYNKKPGRSDYIITPSNLARQDDFWENTKLRTKLMDRPLAYLADSIYAANDSINFMADTVSRNSAIWLDLGPPSPAGNGTVGSIRVLAFKPGRMVFQVSVEKPGYLVLMQNYYPRWRVKMDQVDSRVLPVNGSFMATPVVKGTHRIVFEYYKTDLLWLSLLSVIFVTGGLIYYYFSKKNTLTEPRTD